MRWLSGTVVALAACGFEAHGPPDDAAQIEGPVHVLPDDQRAGTDDLMIGAPIAVDTTAMTFGMMLPSGATFAAAQQAGGGPELAVLHVRALTVRAQVRVTGTRPLVVIADAIDVGALIDVGAHHQDAGPGAATTGGGEPGGHVERYTDSGGGGGSYGSAGAAGGPTSCDGCVENPLPGGAAGTAYNPEVAILTGGSPGGRSYSSPGCDPRAAGGGGGAIELYARTQLVIQSGGGISAGGGGGLGGDRCAGNWLAGHGGGSGGAIVLQSAVIDNRGQLSANGGGGGAGAGQNGDGSDGDDAVDTAIARGGATTGQYSAAGGDGAAQGTPASPGALGPGSGNAGGGGGGLGQIVMFYQTSATAGLASPTPVMKTF